MENNNGYDPQVSEENNDTFINAEDKDFSEKYGPWALVTGASSGFGREFAGELASKGLNIVLTARRKNELDRTAEQITNAFGTETRVIPADLSKENDVRKLIEQTDDVHIGLLVNNAGFANTGLMFSNDIQQEVNMVELSCKTPLVLAHHFGRKMVNKSKGGIIFLSSLVAHISMPYWANYSACKVYNLALAETLHYELKDFGIDVLALCPGASKTNFGEVAKVDLGKRAMRPEEVVVGALNALGRDIMYVPGIKNKVNVLTSRFLPRGIKLELGASVVTQMHTDYMKDTAMEQNSNEPETVQNEAWSL